MAAGQVLFKVGSSRLHGGSASALFFSFITNIYLMSAIVLYACTILVWIYVLKSLPLSVAYPLTALSYVVVPVICALFLNEKIDLYTMLGSLLIIAGVAITHFRSI